MLSWAGPIVLSDFTRAAAISFTFIYFSLDYLFNVGACKTVRAHLVFIFCGFSECKTSFHDIMNFSVSFSFILSFFFVYTDFGDLHGVDKNKVEEKKKIRAKIDQNCLQTCVFFSLFFCSIWSWDARFQPLASNMYNLW